MKKMLSRYTNRVAPTLLILGLLVIFSPLLDMNIRAAPLAGPSVSVNPDRGLAGSKVTVSGSGFSGGYSAVIRWDGADQKTVTMTPNGTFSTSFTIPAGAAPGAHTISVCNNCGGKPEEIASVGFKVIAPATNTPRPTTPPPPKPTNTPTQTLTPTKSLPPSICGDLGLGPQAKVLTFDPFDYRARNMYFDGYGVDFEDSLEGESPPVEPHSGEFAARSIVGEFGSAMQPINMSFARPLQAVGMFVGIDRPEKLDTGISAILTVFGYRGAEGGLVELGLDWIRFPPGPADIVHCLSFTAEEGDLITRAQLEYIDGEGSSAFETRWMDDLTIVFVEEGRLPENRPPVVRIISPEPDVTITDDG